MNLPKIKSAVSDDSVKGRLFYFVGASGAGKDSLLHRLIASDHKGQFVLAERYITRPASLLDDHREIDLARFEQMRKQGEFLFYWDAHGFRYGIHRDILRDLEAGKSVLINGSREYIDEARAVYPEITVVGIEVPLESIAKRLQARGREKQEEITERLERNKRFNNSLEKVDYKISNQGKMEHTFRELSEYLAKPV